MIDGKFRSPPERVFQASETEQAFARFYEGDRFRQRVIEYAPDCRVIKACSAVMPSITGCVQSTMALRVGFRGALINLYLAHADM